ncbi:hypothetical protein FGIG_04214 [Fasciola gigantica]|uniref:Uncharacterized protein n=1 Tax=Fasciola gigantica TaxID=46835 RepID=A0A504Y6Z7_FASGI|nr:hypothetical protein FGIG_04214 [Fasciola gigantica]
MYKNNPAMSSQPQCAEVFAELPAQLQQIDTQLRTKMAQLNLASAQDSSTAAIRGRSTTNPVDGFPIASQSRVPQDQLVQQLMEVQLKPGRLGGPEAVDADFPTIGTWTPHTKPDNEHQEKLLQETIGPKTLTSTRKAVGMGESSNNTNWIGGWSSNGNAPNTNVNTARSGLSNISNWQIGPLAFPSTLKRSMIDGTKAEPPQPQQEQPPQPQLSSQPQQSGSQNTG